MFHFRSVRELRRWALTLTSLAGVAFALVEFDESIWSFEVFPDGNVFPLRALRSTGIYS
jgi:hypothetical protein